SDEDAPAEFLQPPDRLGILQIGARHLVAHGQQHLGDAAHAGSADPDEMDALNLSEHGRSHPDGYSIAARRRIAHGCRIQLNALLTILPLQEVGWHHGVLPAESGTSARWR